MSKRKWRIIDKAIFADQGKDMAELQSAHCADQWRNRNSVKPGDQIRRFTRWVHAGTASFQVVCVIWRREVFDE